MTLHETPEAQKQKLHSGPMYRTILITMMITMMNLKLKILVTGKLCSVEYQINNVISPVMFANALRAISENAIVVEIVPHTLFKSLLSGTHVPLIGRDHPDPLMHLLQALGRLYAAGAQPPVSSLYPPVPWPVSRGTPSLASAIEWDHFME